MSRDQCALLEVYDRITDRFTNCKASTARGGQGQPISPWAVQFFSTLGYTPTVQTQVLLYCTVYSVHGFSNSLIHNFSIQRQVGKTKFLLWRHTVEQVYLGYNHNKSQHCVRIPCFSSREERKVRKGTFCLLPYTICIIFWENYPMFTIFESIEVYNYSVTYIIILLAFTFYIRNNSAKLF